MKDNYYLILIDAYSKWHEVYKVSPPNIHGTLAYLRHAFACCGLPEVIVSENGTQLKSNNFGEFFQGHQIQHVRSPPYHSQSNGQAERFVDTFKRAILKTRGEGTNEEKIPTGLSNHTKPHTNWRLNSNGILNATDAPHDKLSDDFPTASQHTWAGTQDMLLYPRDQR